MQGLKNDETGVENPVWTLAKQVKLQVRDEDSDEETAVDATQHGRNIDKKLDPTYERIEACFEKAYKNLKKRGLTIESDVSVRDALAFVGWYEPKDPITKLAEWLFVENEYAGDVAKLSSFHNVLEEFTIDDFGEDQKFVVDQRGYSCILDGMIAFLNDYFSSGHGSMLLKHRVRQVDYANGTVTAEKDDEVVTLEADFVICTASVGVL